MMMSNSACSITPPLSPSLHQAEQQDVDMLEDFDSPALFLIQEMEEEVEVQPEKITQCFQCQGEVFLGRGAKLYQLVQFHSKSLLKSGILDRILHPARANVSETSVCLFGSIFPYTALRSRMEQLFKFARQTVGEILNCNDRGQALRKNRRQDLVAFLDYVNAFVQRCLPSDENERRKFLHSLLRQLQLLLVYSGRMSEEAPQMKYSLNQLNSIQDKIHHRLELNWYMLTILHTLTTASCSSELPLDVKWCQSPAGEDEEKSVFDQLVSMLLHDLITLTVPIFEKLSHHEWLHTSPFTCTCIMEIWVLLTHMLGYRKERFDTESFWIQLYQILQTVGNTRTENAEEEDVFDSDVHVLTIAPVPSRPFAFCLWLTTHLAHLFMFDHHGNITTPDPTQSCFFAVQMTMEKFMRTSLKEETLRACLRCCLSVSSLWTPSSQLLTLLWEYFSKKLNDRFQLHSTSIAGLAVINKSSSSMLERCRKWSSDDYAGLEQETSFHLFLRLLARLLGHSGALSEWRQIKGRFFSKFHQRRMQELSETGLHNMTCLFLTVAFSVETEEIARKLLALFDMVDPTAAHGRLRQQVWCGALATTLLLVKQKQNFAFLAEKLAASFDSMARQLSCSKTDYSHRQELSALIMLYIDGVRDIVEQSQLEDAEHLLIGEGMDSVLRSCSDSEMRHILTALDSMVMRLRCIVTTQKQARPLLQKNHCSGHTAFANRLWLHVFPFICDHAQTLTPPLSLADLAVSFAHLATDFPAPISTCPWGITGVVRHFISENIQISIACHFLNQVLGDLLLRDASTTTTSSTSSSWSSPSLSPAVMTGAKTTLKTTPLSQTDVVRCWWRCVMLMAPSSRSLMELTEHVMALEDIKWLLSDVNEGEDSLHLGSVGWKQLLKAIGSRYHNSQSLLDKQKIRSQVMPYFADTGHQVAAVVRVLGPLETLLNVYYVLGCLIRYCAPVLYLQSKPCPLPDIIKSLILPSSVFSTDRPLNTNLLAAVRDSLHLFLEGLGRLDYHRDSFIQRQVRCCVTQYLPRFPLSHVDVYNHPVLRLLDRLPHQTTFTDNGFHHFVVEVIIDCLKNKSDSVSLEVTAVLKARYGQL